ncbi:MAG: SRPBCC family protein [Balneolaceae bacterium]
MSAREAKAYTPNIGPKERVASIASGSYLMYKGLLKKKSLIKSLTGGYMLFRGLTGYCALNNAIGIKEIETNTDIDIKTKLIVNKPRNQVYKYWRNLENLPKIMKHIEKVETLDDKKSKWEAKMPGGVGKISWESEITEDVKNEFISWQSLPNSTIENIGNVRFQETGEFETEIQVDITYRVPLGTPGKRVAKLLNPVFESFVKEDIRDFKRIIEEGADLVMDGG